MSPVAGCRHPHPGVQDLNLNNPGLHSVYPGLQADTPIRGCFVDPIISEITNALQKQQMLALTSAPDGSLKVGPLGVISRIWHWNDTKYHEERLSKIAAVIAKVVSVQERLNVVAASKNPLLIAARNLLKDAHYHKAHSQEIDGLEKEVTAAKLGITAEALDNSPGLQKFTGFHHLERYLLIFKDSVQMDPSSKQVMLRKDGEFHPWNEIAEDVKSWPKPTRSPHLAWVYGQDGIQNKDMYDWTELKPFKKGDPATWNHQYVFEFCSCYNPNSIKNGNHSWLRLKTPAGDIYSIGLYRPEKMDWKDNARTPLRIKSGHLMQPDVSEFWNFPISTVDFAITEEVFLKIKETIETDKKNDDQVFQLFNNNCLLYSKKLARFAGVDVPTKVNAIFFFAPANLAKKVSRFLDRLPSFVQKVSLFISSFFINILQMFLGGCVIDKELNECQRKKAIPHLNSLRDLFDINKAYLNHPDAIGFDAHQEVLEWRQKELKVLDEQDSELRRKKEAAINLGLPPSYYLT